MQIPLLLLLLLLSLPLTSNPLHAGSSPVCHEAQETLTRPTQSEIDYTCQQVQSAFEELIRLWKEEDYFQIYDWGKQQSQQEVSRQEFASRMVELDWIPRQLVAEQPITLSFRFRSLIYVQVTLEFAHKTKVSIAPFQKQQTFLLIWENQQWRFDLIHLLRSPF